MAHGITLYHLIPSPNNMKVRIALSAKDLAHERVNVEPHDRTEVIRVSGQPLTPVIEHGDRVVFDSAAILRYLDANFRDTLRLFSEDRAEMQEIERWERFARNDLPEGVGIAFGQFFSGTPDPAEMARANRLLNEKTDSLEEALSGSDWLVGGRITAADVTAAPIVFCGMIPAERADSNPVAGFLRKHFELGAGRDRTRDWVRRVMKHDRI